MNYNSPSEIKSILTSSNIALKKRWGQNFLISSAVREKIIELTTPRKGELIWEIGPGLGAMTLPLLRSGARVMAFEIDWGMIRFLEEHFKTYPELRIIQGDVIKTWESVYVESGRPDKIMGNLPYSSASVIIASFIKKGCIPPATVFTIQRELAQRMAASPGTKNYSSFSILFQFAFSIAEKQDIQRGSFYPAPDVVSSLVKAVPAHYDTMPIDREFFFHVIKISFSSRRKTLLNNLLADKKVKEYSVVDPKHAIEKIGFTPGTRAEELRVEDFIGLSNSFSTAKGVVKE
ncbi:MAG: ribosomal RNA small subunit methyltransferase A [Spirochaetales bacterium]|nr:ribosomal RNA small subunit methyltransferase A [Spirochaetales bacterium]